MLAERNGNNDNYYIIVNINNSYSIIYRIPYLFLKIKRNLKYLIKKIKLIFFLKSFIH